MRRGFPCLPECFHGTVPSKACGASAIRPPGQRSEFKSRTSRALAQLACTHVVQDHSVECIPYHLPLHRYEKAISMKLALRSELLKPLDLRRGEDIDGRAEGIASAGEGRQCSVARGAESAYGASEATFGDAGQAAVL